MGGSSIRFKRGAKKDLPSSATSGTPLWCEDSNELYVGTGNGVAKVGVVSNEVDTTNSLNPVGISDDDTTTLKRNTSVSIKGGTVTAQTFVGDFSGNATSATRDSNGNNIASTYLPKTGGTVTGTLDLTKTTDLAGTANNSPALRIGNVAGEHLEFDGNEIHAKATGTTVGALHINADGGDVVINNTTNKVTVSGGKITSKTLETGATKFTDSVTFANNKANIMGDDAKIGDFNKGGCIGIQSNTNITTGISLLQAGKDWSNSTPYGSLFYNGENMYTDKCGLEKYYVKKVDLSNTSTYNPDTWYPVVGDIIPRTGISRCYMTRITLDVHLDSGTKPAWSTHNSGFTALYDVLQSPNFYGTSTDSSSICIGRNFAWIKDTNTPPAIYRFLEHQGRPYFYLRGGGSYKISTQYICNWQICTASTTFQDQSVAPTTTCPTLMTHNHIIFGNLSGLASKATADANGNNIASTYAKKNEYASLSIGTLIPCFCNSNYVPENCLPLDGSEYTRAQFPNFFDNFLKGSATSVSPSVITLPTFTSNTTNMISVSDSRNNADAYTLINGVTYKQIGTWDSYWFNIDYGKPTIITEYTIRADNSGSPEYPTAWDLKGSNDGIVWTTLNTQKEQTFTLNQSKTYSVSTTNLYKQYRLVFTSGVHASGNGELGKLSFKVLDGPTRVTYSSKLLSCSYETYNYEKLAKNKCAKFAVDLTNNKFKVPYIPNGTHIQQAMENSELGVCYNAGLPNGSIRLSNENGAVDASIASGSNNLESYYTKLSDFNPIFKDDVNTVQTESVALRWFVVVATGTLNQAQMDWTNWASGLQNKLNCDLSNLPSAIDYIKESYVNGSSWYRVYRSGRIEQGGFISSGANSSVAITFLKSFSNANYTFTLGHLKGAGWTNGANVNYYNQTTTSVEVYQCDGAGFSWTACGI